MIMTVVGFRTLHLRDIQPGTAWKGEGDGYLRSQRAGGDRGSGGGGGAL